PADGPGRMPDRTGSDERPRRRELRTEDLARGGDDPDVASLRSFDHAVGLVDGRRHRLVDMDVLARLDRFERVLGVEPDRGDDRDQVDVIALQEVVDVRDGGGDAET